jgi:HEAT repeat protein
MDGKHADAAAAIRAGLESKSPAERLAAVTAFPLLTPMEPSDIQKLAALLRDPAARIRKAAVETVGECGPNAKSTAPTVVKLVRDSDSEIALAAVVALGQLGETDNGVVPALRQTVNRNPAMAKAAQTSLRRLGIPDEGPRDPDQMKKRKGLN